ncbi:MAG: MltA domain-containing protein [Pseudomonadota bacterium]
MFAAVAAVMTTLPAHSDTRLLDWADLSGWSKDDHAAALTVFQETCRDLDDGDWPVICKLSETAGENPKIFFETYFRPVMITDGEDALFTGYYEPELPGSRTRNAMYDVPLYRLPDDVPNTGPWLTREELSKTGVLENRGLELVWLQNEVDKFFLQIQGSGRIRLEDGGLMRVGYGGKNGHPYRSIGQELVRRGEFQEHQVSAPVIRNWVEANPERGSELLNHNPSYVFFREVSQVDPAKGPLGAMNRSITAGRSIAVDPEYVPLGAPVWVEKAGKRPFRKLMIAQDTGSAIKGAQRADVFYGSGDEAGREAGRIRDGGRMIVLLPVASAMGMLNENQ